MNRWRRSASRETDELSEPDDFTPLADARPRQPDQTGPARGDRERSLRAAEQMTRLEARIRDFHRNLASLDASEASVASLSRRVDSVTDPPAAAFRPPSTGAASTEQAPEPEDARERAPQAPPAAPPAAPADSETETQPETEAQPERDALLVLAAAEARAFAERIQTEAKRETMRLRDAAVAEATQLRDAAATEAARTLEAAATQAARTREAAAAEADQTRERARREAEALREAAEQEISARRDAGEEEMQELWQRLETEVDALQNEISARVDRLAARMDAVNLEAARVRADAQAAAAGILAEARAEADRIRARSRAPEVTTSAADASVSGGPLPRDAAGSPESVRDVVDGLAGAVSLIERSLSALADLLGESVGAERSR